MPEGSLEQRHHRLGGRLQTAGKITDRDNLPHLHQQYASMLSWCKQRTSMHKHSCCKAAGLPGCRTNEFEHGCNSFAVKGEHMCNLLIFIHMCSCQRLDPVTSHASVAVS